MIGVKFSTEKGTWIVDLGGNVAEFEAEEEAKAYAQYKIDRILADRKSAYGDFRVMARRLASGWGSILGLNIEPYEVMLCLADLKLARLEIAPDHGDSKLDRAAYLHMAMQLLRENSENL